MQEKVAFEEEKMGIQFREQLQQHLKECYLVLVRAFEKNPERVEYLMMLDLCRNLDKMALKCWPKERDASSHGCQSVDYVLK